MFQHDTGNVHVDFVLDSPLMFHLLYHLDLAFLMAMWKQHKTGAVDPAKGMGS